MNPQQFSNTFDRLTRSVDETIERAAEHAGQHSLKFFQDNFQAGGYEPGKRFVPWAQRKYRVNTPLLNKTGNLAASFQLERKGQGFEVTNTASYAQYLNDGTAHMEARPILYESQELTSELEKLFADELLKLFNS